MYFSQSIADLFLRLALTMQSVSPTVLCLLSGIIIAVISAYALRSLNSNKSSERNLLQRCCQFCFG